MMKKWCLHKVDEKLIVFLLTISITKVKISLYILYSGFVIRHETIVCIHAMTMCIVWLLGTNRMTHIEIDMNRTKLLNT